MATRCLPVLYDPDFAASQILGHPNVTVGGRTISVHAAERMVHGGPGRRAMSLAEVDRVLDEGNVIKKIDVHHPLGSTITVQNTRMPGMPQVVVDAATGKRVVTALQPNNAKVKL